LLSFDITVLFTVLSIIDLLLIEIPRGWGTFLMFLIIGLSSGFLLGVSLTYPREKIKIPMKNVQVEDVKIISGDIFNLDGYTVIPVNEYYSSEVGEGCLADPSSLHGKYIQNIKGGNIQEYEEEKERALEGQNYEEINYDGKSYKKYPIGTVAEVPKGRFKYLLLALCHSDLERNKSNANVMDLWNALMKLWEKCKEKVGRSSVNIPIIGGGFGQIELKPEHIIQLILMSIYHSAKKENIIFPINIIIYHEEYLKYDLYHLKKEWT
ncbi:hypothetical protein LCGC14_2538130, partial [marine sediment metagenome]